MNMEPIRLPRLAQAGLITAAVLLSACNVLAPDGPDEDQALDGFIDGLSPSQVKSHLDGDGEFGRRFSVTDGLGPIFVAASCEQCHVGDGKGHPVFDLRRFGRVEGTAFDPMTELGGPQLQHRSIPGYPPEQIPSTATGVSTLTPPAVTGLGYLDAVDDTTLIRLADPNDLDGDGVSGRLQIHAPSPLIEEVVALETAGSPGGRGTLVQGGYIGRFGKKGLTVNLLHQTVGAYHEDMGITSDLLPEDLFNAQQGSRTSDNAPDPEVSSATVANVVFYLKTLRIPSRRDAETAAVLAGEALFETTGCAACHVPTLRTGRSEIAVLNEVDFHPYTDLLLHDVGSALDDGYTEGRAETNEWRTPPLWGIGIQENFQGGSAFYLHDGRARSLTEAIELHGGEAQASRDAFMALLEESKDQLIAFLRSL